MRRRRLLAAVPALLAGCTGSGDETPPQTTRSTSSTTPTTAPPTTEPPTETPPPYDRIPVDPASMTAEEVQARIANRDCAGLVDLPTICSGNDGKLGVSVSPTVGRLSDEVVEFTVENQADEAFMTNHYGWQLQKWDGTRWRHIAPLGVPLPIAEMAPGETHTHRIESVPSKVIRSPHAYITRTDVTIGGLGPGVYGFSSTGHFKSTPDDERGTAAIFGFSGEAPPVSPTDDVTGVERNGSELVVRADPPGEERGDVVVTLASGEPDIRLLPEHVRQLAGLRNTLPFAATDGIETIRYVGSRNDEQIAQSYLDRLNPDGLDRYGFRGYTFEVTAEA